MTKEKRKFYRLSTKFFCGITAILVLILGASLFINSKIAGRYYLRQQAKYVKQIGDDLKEYLAHNLKPDQAVEKLEERENILIVYAQNTSDYDGLSTSLREKFREKGLGFKKFWLWDQDYQTAIEKGHQFRYYQQEKLNYGILVEYLPIGDNLYAVAAIIPNTTGFLSIISQFSILLYVFSLLTAVILMYFLVKHITNPLRQIESFSQKISCQEYGTLNIRTHDELENVAESMNQMSSSIQQYQKMLQSKNQQMEQLLNDVAHDLKTPISLIGMYSSGMKDGLDDGTFLETIIEQNSKMSQLTERLLSLSRIGQKEHPLEKISLDKLLITSIEEQKLFVKERGLHIHKQIEPDVEILGNALLITQLFTNLISNGIKYASSEDIQIILERKGKQCRFQIINEFQNENLDLEKIWEPFYVGEASRNKALSGTGLGLPMVKKIAEQFGYFVQCTQDGNKIIFEILFIL